LSGELVKSDDDRNQLLLIAVNSKKWKDAVSEETKAYLSTLHHGILTEDNSANFIGVKTETKAFKNFQRAVRIACAQTKQQEYKEKGDDFMATKYASFITDEEKSAAQKEGMALARTIIRLLKENVPVDEIANKYQLSAWEVEEFRVV